MEALHEHWVQLGEGHEWNGGELSSSDEGRDRTLGRATPVFANLEDDSSEDEVTQVAETFEIPSLLVCLQTLLLCVVKV